jgi:hypothetical protein
LGAAVDDRMTSSGEITATAGLPGAPLSTCSSSNFNAASPTFSYWPSMAVSGGSVRAASGLFGRFPPRVDAQRVGQHHEADDPWSAT